jgi:DNA-binding NarL/FixJ family response regulator
VRAGPGDAARSQAVARDSLRVAHALDLTAIAERAAAVLAGLDGDAGASPLSTREAEVAALVAEGLTNREIARRLVISDRTAQNHVQHILTKLGFTSRSQIAVWAARGR